MIRRSPFGSGPTFSHDRGARAFCPLEHARTLARYLRQDEAAYGAARAGREALDRGTMDRSQFVVRPKRLLGAVLVGGLLLGMPAAAGAQEMPSGRQPGSAPPAAGPAKPAASGKGTTQASAGGSSRAALAAAAAPGNDNFANASTYPSNTSSRAGSTAGATKEGGEPSHAGFAGGASLWFRWTSPVSSLITFQTNGSSFDTLLAVYQGTSLTSLRSIAFNDDASSSTLTSAVTFRTSSATSYYIALDGYGGASGNYSLNVSWSSGSGRQTYNSNVFRDAGYGSQCTAFALDRMRDATGLWMKVSGNAMVWGSQARSSGWPVGKGASATGSVLVMQPNYSYWIWENGRQYQTQVNAVGHVGWADSLSGGWVHIRDQNWNGDGRTGDRWVWAIGAPVEFIYA